MARKSEIEKYPAALIAYIDSVLDNPKHNLDEQTEIVNQAIANDFPGEKPATRSSLARYAKKRREKFEQQLAIMRQQKAQRAEFFERFGDEGLDNAGRYAAEMVYSTLMQLQNSVASIMSAVDGGDIDLGDLDKQSKIIARFATSIGALEKSLSENKSRVDAIRNEAMQQAAQAIEEKSKQLDQPSDITAALRQAIMDGLKK